MKRHRIFRLELDMTFLRVHIVIDPVRRHDTNDAGNTAY